MSPISPTVWRKVTGKVTGKSLETFLSLRQLRVKRESGRYNQLPDLIGERNQSFLCWIQNLFSLSSWYQASKPTSNPHFYTLSCIFMWPPMVDSGYKCGKWEFRHIRKGRPRKEKQVFFRALPELAKPPPSLPPIRATWSSFSWCQSEVLRLWQKKYHWLW